MSGMSRSFTLETVPEAAEGDTLARCCFFLFKPKERTPASPCSCLLRSSAPSEESVTRGLHGSSKDKLEISNAKKGPGLGAFSLLRLLHVGDIHPHHVVAWWLLL